MVMHAEFQIALALGLGVALQSLAFHLRLPGIVLLLVGGVFFGPEGFGLLNPKDIGEELMHGLTSFAVAVILFEGGLALDFKRLRSATKVIRNLITIGALITLGGAMLTAHVIMGWSWMISFLFGTLVIVTGPTVVGPLMHRMNVKRNLSSVLEAEGVLIDAVGAIIATVGLTVALSAQADVMSGGLTFLESLLVGSLVGGGAGVLLTEMLAYNLIPHHIEKIAILCVVVLLFQVSNALMHESGIAAVIAAGAMLAHKDSKSYIELREFKEQLTQLFIGLLFILLAADVDLNEIQSLGWPGVGVVATLIFIVRPLSVFISTLRSDLKWSERLFIGMIGPRGIIAAAVASMFASRMAAKGVGGGEEIRALVFLMICLSVLSAAVLGPLLGNLLGLRRGKPEGWVIFGAGPLGRLMGRAMKKWGVSTRLIDTNWDRIRQAQEEGLQPILGNALEEESYKKARLDDHIGVIGLIQNPEFNWLFVTKVREYYKDKRRLMVLTRADVDHPSKGRVTESALKGDGVEMALGGRLPLKTWFKRIDNEPGQLIELEWLSPHGEDVSLSEWIENRAPLLPLLSRRGGQVSPIVEHTQFTRGDHLMAWVPQGELETTLVMLREMGWRLITEMNQDAPPQSTGESPSPSANGAPST